MKKRISVLMALIMMFSCIHSVFAESVPEISEISKITVTTAAEEYLTEWFTDELSEHYTLYNFDFTFTTSEYKNGLFDSYGYLEVDHHLRYNSLDELPFVKGVIDTLNINSMESVVDGDFVELQSVMSPSTTSRIGTATLSPVQTQYLAQELKKQFSAVEDDLGDFNASYFFHISANFDGKKLSNIEITLEAPDVGYLSPEECLPETAKELYNDGANIAREYVVAAQKYDESDVLSAGTSRTYANYDRIAARDYALRYATNPTQSCKCGALSYNSSSSFPDGVNYAAWNNTEYKYFDLFCHNDCADFVSQAMSEGGLPEAGTWFRTKNSNNQNWGAAWTNVQNLKSYMTSRGYWTSSNYASCNAGNILLTSSNHVTMITLNNTVTHCYTAHTNDRDNATFSNSSSYAYYAINLN